MLKSNSNEIVRNFPLFALVADTNPKNFDYREVLRGARIQWGFASNAIIFAEALRLQPWDVIIVDQSMLEFIPDELLVAAAIKGDNQELILLIGVDLLEDEGHQELFKHSTYLIRGPMLHNALTHQLHRILHLHSFQREHAHLEMEIARILEDWEQSVRDRTSKLEKSNQAFKNIDEIKSRFLANLSHRLRTPLTVIRSYVDLLIKCPIGETQERQEFLEIVSSEAICVSEMIDDLLELAKIDAREFDWEMARLDLREIVPEFLQSARISLDKHNLSCSYSIPRGIPRVEANEARIQQVFNHLISNSVSNLNEGGEIYVQAHLAAEESEMGWRDVVIISVRDTGNGFSERDLLNIFNRFEQEEKQAEGQRTATLGLAICKEIIEHHGGRIWAQNGEDGVGLTISFSLRALQPEKGSISDPDNPAISITPQKT